MKKKHIRPPGLVVRGGSLYEDMIAEALGVEPKTVPELAEALGMPSHEVMMHLMAMRRYGRVEELPRDRRDDYFRYRLVEKQVK